MNKQAFICIMFVCHGNICRSTMAEFIMKDIVERYGLSNQIFVASAATSAEEIGNPVHPGTRELLKRKGISCEGKRAVQLCASDYDYYDMFIGMDSANIRNMRRQFVNDPQGKVYKLLEFAQGCTTDEADDVADPWYTGDFELTYISIERGCDALLAWIQSNMGFKRLQKGNV